MNEVFKEIPEGKQQEILNAAFKEFGEHGYKRASTNTIIKAAGISKGMLFYYFNNKQELYNDLVSIALDGTLEQFRPLLDAEPSDYIDWLYEIAKQKLQYQHKHSELVRFLGQLFMSGDFKYLDNKVRARYEEVRAEAEYISRKQMDMALFRDDIPQDVMKNMVMWVIEGYQKQAIGKMTSDAEIWTDENMESLWDEFYEILEVLKKVFYKESE